MPYTVIYRLQFTNIENNDITIEISDKASFVSGIADITYYDLVPAGAPFVVSVVDNDESKATAIRATQCDIKFISNENFGRHTFSAGEDDRFLVKAYINDRTSMPVFVGSLIMDDISEPFLPRNASVGNEVKLTAIDGLGTLKELPMVDFNGKNPKGKNLIIQYLAWSLFKTSLKLPIMVEMGIMEQSFPGKCAWNHIYVDAKTYEKEIGESEDCYTVIEKTLKAFGCYLKQVGGSWYIKRVDEFDTQPAYRYYFDWNGQYINEQAPVFYDKKIGENEDIYFLNDSTEVVSVRPSKSIKVTFNYNYPTEIVDNIDFSRGNIYTPLVMPPNTTYYRLDDWETVKDDRNTIVTGDFLAYIKRTYTPDGYENERYAVMTAGAYGNMYAIRSNPIQLGYNDKFSLSFDERWTNRVLRSGEANVARIILTTKTRIYSLQFSVIEKPRGWIPGDLGFLMKEYFRTDDVRQWNTASFDAPPVPEAGFIRIELINNTVTDVEKHFSNLQFTYTPFVNGTYRKFTGSYYTVTRPGSYKRKQEAEVSISDSIKELFKGTMFKIVGGQYVMTEKWYNGAVFHTGLPDAQYLHPLGAIVTDDLWNQYRNQNNIFRCSLGGLGTVDIPDLHHKYFILDADPASNNRYFMCVGYEQDFLRCEWTATLIEVYNTTTGKIYNDEKTFKYVTDNASNNTR